VSPTRDPSPGPGQAFGRLLDAIRGLKWPARRPVGGVLPGAHRSRLRGAGGEFSEYRPYRQGDDPRRIDWRLLARSDRAFVRLADDHALLPTLLVVDASASMDFPAPGHGVSKWECARAMAVGLAAVAHAVGDPVGLAVATAGRTVRLPPRARRGVVGEIATALGAVRPMGDAALAPLVAHAPTAGRLAILSDFLGDSAGESTLRAAAAYAAAGGDVLAVHVVADAELDPPRHAVLAVDPERPEVRRALVGGARDEYVARFAEWRRETARAWRDAGVAFAMVTTGEPAERAVRRVVRAGEPGAGAEGRASVERPGTGVAPRSVEGGVAR
jgi:uncharacterized protein (DUF58 family)